MKSKFGKSLSALLIFSLIVMMLISITILAAEEKEMVKELGVVAKLEVNNLKLKNIVSIPHNLKKSGYKQDEVGPYIIVFDGPIEDPMKGVIQKTGANLVEYIPEFSFLALMTPEIAERVAALPYIVDIMIYEPAFKVNPSLKDTSGNIKGFGDVILNIVTFDDFETNLDNYLSIAHAQKLNVAGKNKVVKINRNQIATLANLNSVKYIEEAPQYVLFNDIAKDYMGVDNIWTLGYDGTGQVVGICDTGLDTGVNDSSMHLDFQGRIDAIYALGRSTADDPHGHGTHVAGSVLGDGARSSGQIKGIAPDAHMVFQSVLDSGGGLGGLPSDLNDLFAQAWSAGARIHTNSWGADVLGDYNTDSRQVDEYVWGNDMIILFAAGNDGTSDDVNVDYQTVGSPGTAKNCITVGATENYRPSMPITRWGNVGDEPDKVVLFSSRGWCEDGRVKPDIVAPGTWILSTKSTQAPDSNFWETYNTYYAYMGGTSMATPLTAGAIAVAREYMQSEWGHTPSPAMMKAAIINGGTDLGYGFPSQDQGWGRVNLNDSLASKEYKYEDESVSLNTGNSQNYNYYVESSNTPLKITLVWTDYPGSTIASKALVNDLDMKVTAPSGTIYYGNDFTSPYNSTYDRLNNVENVFIITPEVGTYTIEINGYNIPSGPQDFALFASADFGTGSSDTEAPVVSITAPTGGTVSNTVTYSANATDNIGVTRVDFYVGSTQVGSDTTSPYSINWDTTQQSNGTYDLITKAFDAAGNMGQSTAVTVTIDNVITTTELTENFSGYVSRTGTRSVEFYIDVTNTGDIDLNLSWSGSADLDMFLYNPSGSEVARAYTLANPETISYTATTTGRYKIKVDAYSSSATFSLVATHPINPNITASYEDTRYTSTYYDYYISVGNSGSINIDLSWSDSADLDIFLYNPSGSEVARAYTLRNPECISYPVDTTGTYRVRVDAYSGSATYTVKINYPQ